MHYYIDGYNLMFRTLRAGNDLQSQRRQIILDLNEKIQLLELDVTIVFDSQYQISESTRTHYNYLEIYFTDQGETADEYILDELKKKDKPQLHTLVTSDKKLAWLAKLRSVKTETVEEFTKWLNKRYSNKLRNIKNSNRTTNQMNMVEKEGVKRDILPTKPIEPLQNSTPEECFDFYLNHFEENFQETVKQKIETKPIKIKKDLSIKKKKQVQLNLEDPSSILERWEKAFGRNPELDQNDW